MLSNERQAVLNLDVRQRRPGAFHLTVPQSLFTRGDEIIE